MNTALRAVLVRHGISEDEALLKDLETAIQEEIAKGVDLIQFTAILPHGEAVKEFGSLERAEEVLDAQAMQQVLMALASKGYVKKFARDRVDIQRAATVREVLYALGVVKPQEKEAA